MNIAATLTEKKNTNTELKRNYGLFQKFKPLGLIRLSNKEITQELIEGLKVLSAGFVVVVEDATEEQISKNIIITDNVDITSLV
jgi:hypothetical protein